MAAMKGDLKAKYVAEAEAHVDFLCEQVFKPAFRMAFIHGVKHGREDMLAECKATIEARIKKGESQ
jgi:hypothetical protein